MPKGKTTRSRRRIAWSEADLRKLRALAGKKSLMQIAGALNRSKAAVQVKASSHQLSLRVRSKPRAAHAH